MYSKSGVSALLFRRHHRPCVDGELIVLSLRIAYHVWRRLHRAFHDDPTPLVHEGRPFIVEPDSAAGMTSRSSRWRP